MTTSSLDHVSTSSEATSALAQDLTSLWTLARLANLAPSELGIHVPSDPQVIGVSHSFWDRFVCASSPDETPQLSPRCPGSPLCSLVHPYLTDKAPVLDQALFRGPRVALVVVNSSARIIVNAHKEKYSPPQIRMLWEIDLRELVDTVKSRLPNNTDQQAPCEDEEYGTSRRLFDLYRNPAGIF